MNSMQVKLDRIMSKVNVDKVKFSLDEKSPEKVWKGKESGAPLKSILKQAVEREESGEESKDETPLVVTAPVIY